MSINRTDLFEPKNVPKEVLPYLFTLQRRQPLIEIDTTGGSETYSLPQAGLESGTGQSNQNAEYVIIKTSADVNTVTIIGNGITPVVLTTQSPAVGSTARFKSNGAVWRQVA